MNINRKSTGEFLRRGAGAALIVTLIAGSVSLASFADMGYVDSVFGVKAVGESVRLTATGSEAVATASTARYASRPGLSEMLEQSTDHEGAIIPTWFRVSLNGEAIVDSSEWDITLEPHRKLMNDTAVKHELRVTIYPQKYELGDGDSVTWNLGRMEGLSLDGEFYEQLVLSGGVYAGDVMLYYTEEGEVFLYTEFKDAIRRYSSITIDYWYDCGFANVDKPTEIEFDLPGYREPVPALLIPDGWDDEETKEPSTEETTKETEPPTEEPTSSTEAPTTEPTSATEGPTTTVAPTTVAPTTPAPTTVAPTTAEPTTEPTTAVDKNKGSGGGSDRDESTAAKETTKSAETIAESIAETVAETESQPIQSEAQEQSPQEPQDDPSEEEAGEPDETEPDEVLDINISFGAEVAASHGMQSQVLPDEILTYRMVLTNDSEDEIKDVRIRDYLPEHTSFVSTGTDGIYGVVDGQQYITWMLDRILPGETVELTFQVRVFPCTPPDYPVRNQVYWQSDDSRSANNQEQPENQVDFPMITIG